jgi:hypothetical protein
MACIKLKGPLGERTIPENTRYQLLIGEAIDGVVWDCGPNIQVSDEVGINLERAGIKWGDAIAWATSKFGISQCSSCKARQAILNKVGEVGWIETLKELKKTII